MRVDDLVRVLVRVCRIGRGGPPEAVQTCCQGAMPVCSRHHWNCRCLAIVVCISREMLLLSVVSHEMSIIVCCLLSHFKMCFLPAPSIPIDSHFHCPLGLPSALLLLRASFPRRTLHAAPAMSAARAAVLMACLKTCAAPARELTGRNAPTKAAGVYFDSRARAHVLGDG